MAGEDQQQQPEVKTPAAKKGGGAFSAILPWLIAFAPQITAVLVFVIFLAVVFAIINSQKALQPPDMSAKAGDINCTSWDNAPADTQQILQAAAQEFKISPALFGSIYLQENGGAFKSASASYATGQNGQGPFQFTKKTWKGTIMPAFKDFTEADVTDFTKSARGSAYYIHGLYKNVAKIYGVSEGNYSEEVVRGTALAYNRGAGCAASVCSSSDSVSEQEIYDFIKAHPKSFPQTNGRTYQWYTDIALKYMDGAWKYFQDLDKKCTSATAYGAKGASCGLSSVKTTNIINNGNLSSSKLVMMPQAAADFDLLIEAFKAKTGKKLPILQIYRTPEDQISLYNKVGGTQANKPGTSMHEAGLAVDINWQGLSAADYWIFRNMAPTYKFKIATKDGVEREYGKNECWHFDYIGFKDKFWYGAPKITNAINAAHGQCSS